MTVMMSSEKIVFFFISCSLMTKLLTYIVKTKNFI